MFTGKKKFVLIIMIIFIMSFNSVVLYAECDMMAMIAKKGNSIAWISGSESQTYLLPDDPHDYFKFLYEFSSNNPDGYGIIYMDSDGTIPEIDFPDLIGSPTQLYDVSEQAWYVITDNVTSNDYTIEDYPGPYEDAKSKILESSNDVSVVLGHVRNATGTTYGSHPFQIICDTNDDEIDETYMFMHNGNVTDMVSTFRSEILNLDNSWFDENPSNYEGSPTGTTGWIDSEMYFHYLMAHVKDADGNFMKGIYNALSNVSADYQTGISINEGLLENNVNANFVLTDGENLYLYRNCNSNSYRLAYDEDENGFFGVQTNNSQSQFTLMQQNSFVIISQYGDPVVMNNFLMDDDYHINPAYIVEKTYYSYNFVSGDIDNNTTDLNIHYPNTYISGNTYINSSHTLDLDSEIVGAYTFSPEIKFAGNQNLFIEGTLNVNEDASLNISNSSLIEVSGSGELFLDWGSIITGTNGGWYEATPPGQPTGNVDYIPGDRIIAQNGGKITTDIPDNFTPGTDDPITISSSSNELWDGIFIETPDNGDTYWFVNCNISGISNLSIANVSETQDVANLELYLTDFTDAGQIVARHGHNLSITGSSAFAPCSISNNHQTPIVAYDSPVYIQYALIEENGRDENGGLLNSSCDGIYLNYASNTDSEILNCVIQDNTGNGISTYYEDVNIVDCTIQTNEDHGILTKDGTFDDLHNTTVMNNDCAEYVGCQDSYNWWNESNTIQDLDGNTGGNDQYILMAYKWDEIEESIWVYGNTINYQGNTTRFYPDYEAFKFETDRSLTMEALLLQTALMDMRNGNYLIAESGFQEIISQYPDSNEAAVAIRALLFIESYTDQDYVALINYIDTIQISEASPLYKAKEDVKTKSYMKDKEYEIAIERLEVIINTSSNPDDVILAMIDEGYCYMELASGGSRSLPENCTVKTETFDSYQMKVRELESQFSFFPEQENQNNLPATSSILSSTNYPNPFNPSTSISFNLALDCQVSVAVYNMRGQKVKQLISDQLSAGQHTIEWNGKDSNDKSVASGIYFYKISAGKDYNMSKMLLLK